MMDAHPPEDAQGVEAEDIGRLLPAPPVPELADDRLRELHRGVMSEIRAQRPRARRPRRRVVAAFVVGIAVAVILGGVAVASGFNPLRTLWPTNERGQTYGAAGLARSYEDVPDLIAVAGGGNVQGYCFKTDLD